jgi:hypothetical protein
MRQSHTVLDALEIQGVYVVAAALLFNAETKFNLAVPF